MTDTTAGAPGRTVALREPHYAAVGMRTFGNGALPALENLADVVSIAQLMAKSQIAVPKHLRENPGACLAVTMRALSWNADPFAIASKTYSVNDQIAYEAQVIAAVLNTQAPIKGRPVYTWEGEGGKRKCTVTVETLDGQKLDYTSPEFDKITPKNSPLWKSDPDQQQGYYAVRSLGRRHFPDVIMGIYDREELEYVAASGGGADQTSGVAARLEAAERPQGGNGSATGFNGSQREEVPPHDAVTGEILKEEGPGQPQRDELHFLDGVPAAKNGSRQSFKNGKPHSVLPNKKPDAHKSYPLTEEELAAIFAPPAPEPEPEPEEEAPAEVEEEPEAEAEAEVEVEAEPEAEAETTPEAEEDPPAAEAGDGGEQSFPPEFEAYIEEIEAATSWPLVKAAMHKFYSTACFKGFDIAQQNKIRANTWETCLANKLTDLPDFAGDVTAFRLWIEWIDTPEAADAVFGTMRVIEQDAVFSSKDDTFKAAIRQAVAARISILKAR